MRTNAKELRNSPEQLKIAATPKINAMSIICEFGLSRGPAGFELNGGWLEPAPADSPQQMRRTNQQSNPEAHVGWKGDGNDVLANKFVLCYRFFKQ
jgi:hypothetical protein